MLLEASRGTGAQSVTVNATGCGFDPHLWKWNIYLKFIFPCLSSGVQAKRGVEFRSTQYAIPPKLGGKCFNDRFPACPAVCEIQREAALKKLVLQRIKVSLAKKKWIVKRHLRTNLWTYVTCWLAALRIN